MLGAAQRGVGARARRTGAVDSRTRRLRRAPGLPTGDPDGIRSAAERTLHRTHIAMMDLYGGRRTLHREVIRQRNKIVAHAESRFFDSKMVRSSWTPEDVRVGDYRHFMRRVYPKFDLEALPLNTVALRNACAFIANAIAPEARRGQRLPIARCTLTSAAPLSAFSSMPEAWCSLRPVSLAIPADKSLRNTSGPADSGGRVR